MRSIKSQSVGPRQAVALICTTWAITPICCRSVCVAACSATRTTWAAAPICAVSVGGRSPCVWLCMCLADTHGVSSVVRIDCKMRNCECPQARGVAGISPVVVHMAFESCVNKVKKWFWDNCDTWDWVHVMITDLNFLSSSSLPYSPLSLPLYHPIPLLSDSY